MWEKKISSDGSSVTTSSTNGHLTVNGTDITVYDDSSLNKSVIENLSDAGDGILKYKGYPIGSGGGLNVTTSQSGTFNLFDKSQLSSPVPSPVDTPKIPVKEGYIYTWSGGNATYTIYDSNQVILTTATAQSCKIPSGGVYLSIKVYGGQTVTDTFVVTQGTYKYDSTNYIPYQQQVVSMYLPQGLYKSKWYGKTWWALGDSITTGNGKPAGTANVYASEPYHYVLAHQRFIKVTNDSTSGYTIGNIYSNKVVNMPPSVNSPDLITIMAGTNDHGFNTVMGTINDVPSTSGSFYAVYKKSIEDLKAKYPLVTIGLITPIERFNTGGTDGKVANAAGFTLRQYCDAVIAIANYYQLPYIDIYNNLGFTPYNTSDYTNFFCSDGGTHPNDLGHIRMAARIGSFIERI